MVYVSAHLKTELFPFSQFVISRKETLYDLH